mgnify:CR=1 FL=1
MGFFSALRTLPMRRPFIFGVGLAGTKNGLCDILVQMTVEEKEMVDWTRTSVFVTFGLLFNGAWQYALFVKMMPRVCPNAVSFVAKPWRAKLKDTAGMKAVGVQCLIENGINNPLIYFPLFYTVQEYLAGGDWRNGISKYKQNAAEDLPAIWALWVPAQLFNFAFSPMWFRVPFVASVSAIWTSYVSYTRGDREKR